MKHLMPLKRFIVEITNQADPNDLVGMQRAIKGWHNKLYHGTIPRALVKRLGRELFINLESWEKWLDGDNPDSSNSGPGRPRTK